MREYEGLPRDAAELMALVEREPIEDALVPLDPERLADARAGGGLAWGVTGHGLMSWSFRLVVRTAKLDIDITRPALRLLEDDETQARLAADIRTVSRLAALAICRAENGRIGRLMVRSDSTADWSWCLEFGDRFCVGDVFSELVDVLVVGGRAADPLEVEYV